MLPRLILEARKGDDALLRAVLDEFRKEGFSIEGAHEARSDLLLGAGPLGRHAPHPGQQADIARALEVARRIGDLDIGQGAVVCDGLVLAVEAQEGTDAMLRRVAEEVAPALRGSPGARKGVLAKTPKPIQETRVDLPTLGPATVRGAARAGLAGTSGRRAGPWSLSVRRSSPWPMNWASLSSGSRPRDVSRSGHHARRRRTFRR